MHPSYYHAAHACISPPSHLQSGLLHLLVLADAPALLSFFLPKLPPLSPQTLHCSVMRLTDPSSSALFVPVCPVLKPGIMCFDITRKVTYTNLSKWWQELQEYRKGIPCLVVANKIDLDMKVTQTIQYATCPTFPQAKNVCLSRWLNRPRERIFLSLSSAGAGDKEVVQFRCKAKPALLLRFSLRRHQRRQGLPSSRNLLT